MAFIDLQKRWNGSIQRSCGDCSACCDHFEIEEIKKDAKQRCPFLKITGGCSIHAAPEMPKTCSRYACAWIMGYGKSGDRPDKSGVIVDFRDGLAGEGLYGHFIQIPTEDTLCETEKGLYTMDRISKDVGLDVHLEKRW